MGSKMRAVLLSTTACLGLLAASLSAPAAPGVGKAVPIVDASWSLLLGGTLDGKWAKPAVMGRAIKGGERYRLYSLTRSLGEGVGGKATPSEVDDALNVEIKPQQDAAKHVLAVGGDWNALPRVPRVESNSVPDRVGAVRSALRSHGIRNPRVNVTQTLRVDLEGDGQDEVLISATTPNRNYVDVRYGPKTGDYSLVLLRKIGKGGVVDTLLDGEFYPRARKDAAPNVYHVAGVLDVNGDGVMEVIVDYHYYEGGGVDVYSVQGGKARKVCGGFSGV
jgi:hypothetical protein